MGDARSKRPEITGRHAIFSDCRKHRFMLERIWDENGGRCVFIGLNPSTADEQTDDPTVRRCIGFAQDWGYGRLWMLNLFSWRSTDPSMIVDSNLSARQENFWHLKNWSSGAGIVVAAWGTHSRLMDRGSLVRTMLQENGCVLHHLGLTKGGHPKHPLYLRSGTRPTLWE